MNATSDVISKLVDHITTTRAYASELTDEQFSARYQEVVNRAKAVKLNRDQKGEHRKAIIRNWTQPWVDDFLDKYDLTIPILKSIR